MLVGERFTHGESVDRNECGGRAHKGRLRVGTVGERKKAEVKKGKEGMKGRKEGEEGC